MTLAPRSWPSSPGFATMIRIGPPSIPILQLQARRLLKRPELLAQHCANLTQARVGLHGVDNRGHQTVFAARNLAHIFQSAGNLRVIARRLDVRETLLLLARQ